MINQGMDMMGYKSLVFIGVFLMLLVPVMAGDLSKELPKQVDSKEVLDASYLVQDDGVYFKDLKQTKPIVWIDKKVGDVYHVDSLKTFVKDESVTLKFFYKIQPDWIKHYTHSGKFDRTYYPSDWNWTPNCITEEDCDGGYVTIIVENIEEGTGSSTFPIGITGPTWNNDGVLVTLTETTDYILSTTTGLFTIVNTDYYYSWLEIDWSYNKYTTAGDSNEDSIGAIASFIRSIGTLITFIMFAGVIYIISKWREIKGMVTQ